MVKVVVAIVGEDGGVVGGVVAIVVASGDGGGTAGVGGVGGTAGVVANGARIGGMVVVMVAIGCMGMVAIGVGVLNRPRLRDSQPIDKGLRRVEGCGLTSRLLSVPLQPLDVTGRHFRFHWPSIKEPEMTPEETRRLLALLGTDPKELDDHDLAEVARVCDNATLARLVKDCDAGRLAVFSCVCDTATLARVVRVCDLADVSRLVRYCCAISVLPRLLRACDDDTLSRIAAVGSVDDVSRIMDYCDPDDLARLVRHCNRIAQSRLLRYCNVRVLAKLAPLCDPAELAQLAGRYGLEQGSEALAGILRYCGSEDLARILASPGELALGGELKSLLEAVPTIDKPYTAILAASNAAGCGLQGGKGLALWTVKLAGDAGRALEKATTVRTAAALILRKSRPEARLPDFSASHEAALAFVEVRAGEEA